MTIKVSNIAVKVLKVDDEDNRYSHLKNEFYGKNHFGVILKQKYTFDELDNIKNL